MLLRCLYIFAVGRRFRLRRVGFVVGGRADTPHSSWAAGHAAMIVVIGRHRATATSHRRIRRRADIYDGPPRSLTRRA